MSADSDGAYSDLIKFAEKLGRDTYQLEELGEYIVTWKDQFKKPFLKPKENIHDIQFYTAFAALGLIDITSFYHNTEEADFLTLLEASSILATVILDYLKLHTELIPNGLLVFPLKYYMSGADKLTEKPNMESLIKVMNSSLDILHPTSLLGSRNKTERDFAERNVPTTSRYAGAKNDIDLKLLTQKLTKPKKELRYMASVPSLYHYHGLGSDTKQFADAVYKAQVYQNSALAHIVRSNGVAIIVEALYNAPYTSVFVEYFKSSWQQKRYICQPNICVSTASEKNSFVYLYEEIEFIHQMLQLDHIFKALSKDLKEKLSYVAIACLFAGLHVSHLCYLRNSPNVVAAMRDAEANGSINKEADGAVIEKFALMIVERSINCFDRVAEIHRTANIQVQNVTENLYFGAAWLLFTGLNDTLFQEVELTCKRSDPCRENPSVINFNNMYVAIASYAIHCFEILASDASFVMSTENRANIENETFIHKPLPADIASLSPTQRIEAIFAQVPFIQLLLDIAFICYRKSSLERKIAIQRPKSATEEISEDVMVDEEDNDDDDSEPILGQWFESTVGNCTEDTPKKKADEKGSAAKEEGASFFSILCRTQFGIKSVEKTETVGYILLTNQIFNSLNEIFRGCKFPVFCTYEKNYYESTISTLAALIKEIDRDPWFVEDWYENIETDDLEANESNKSKLILPNREIFLRFSNSLKNYVDYLITHKVISANQSVVLLDHFGLNVRSGEPWSLVNHRRALCILLQVLSLKESTERENESLRIFERVFLLLQNIILDHSLSSNVTDLDLNLENALFLVYLFNMLTLTSKKVVLFELANRIIICSKHFNVDNKPVLSQYQLISMFRLIQFFDYILRHLYDPPARILALVEHFLIDPNGTYATWNVSNKNLKLDTANKTFYVLTTVENNSFFDVPKVDGLAFLSILSHRDKSSYKNIINALVSMTKFIDLLNPVIKRTSAVHPDYPKAVKYCFTISWKVLMTLPPPSEHIKSVTSFASLSTMLCLYNFVWAARISSPTIKRWLTETLMKADRIELNDSEFDKYDALLTDYHNIINDPRFIFAFATSFTEKVNLKMPEEDKLGAILNSGFLPNVSDIIFLDFIFQRLQASMLFSQPKKNKSASNNCSQSDNESSDSSCSEHVSKSNTTENSHYEIEQLIVEHNYLVKLVKLFETVYCLHNYSILYYIANSDISYSEREIIALRYTLPVATSVQNGHFVNPVSSDINACLSDHVKQMLKKWSSLDISQDHYQKVYVTSSNQIEANFSGLVEQHLSQIILEDSNYTIIPSLKFLLKNLIVVIGEFTLACPNDKVKKMKEDIMSLFLHLNYDACTENLETISNQYVDKVATNVSREGLYYHSYLIYAKNLYRLIVNATYKNKKSDKEKLTNTDLYLDDQVFIYSLDWFRSLVLVSESSKLMALEKFFLIDKEHNILAIFSTIFTPALANRPACILRVFKFVNQLFALAEEIPNEQTINKLCRGICNSTTNVRRCGQLLAHVLKQYPKPEKSDNLAIQASTQSQAAPVVTLGISSISGSVNTSNESDDNRSENLEGTAAVSATSETPIRCAVTQDKFDDQARFLKNLINFLIRNDLQEEAHSLVIALVSVLDVSNRNPQSIPFPELLNLLKKLAEFDGARGHQHVFETCLKLLRSITKTLSTDKEFRRMCGGHDSAMDCVILENISHLLMYVCEFLAALFPEGTLRNLSDVINDGEAFPPPLEFDMEWNDDAGILHDDEEDSGGYDSDEDSFCNKLCTFTITHKEFMSQHWYHCLTCKMVDSVGVCSVCVKVCHKNHDITYSKFGNFFCDCGAKENGKCMALSKRTPQESTTAKTNSFVPTSSTKHQDTPAEPNCPSNEATSHGYNPLENSHGFNYDRIEVLRKTLEPISGKILSTVWSLIPSVLEFLEELKPVLRSGIPKISPVGVFDRTSEVLGQLHNIPFKFVEYTDDLMYPVMSSQEGAFDNLRLNSNGDHMQTIRQLISNHSVRRTCMCIMSSPQSKRQLLVVTSPEKGKINLFSLGGLLKQMDPLKKKIGLITVASISVPITVISISANPCNDQVLAVCGLKECIVFTFSSGISMSIDSFSINPHCETSNFIIKALWLPGNQTTLAIVTSLNIKIYQLDKSTLYPWLYFVLPTGKIRDATFVCEDNGSSTIFIMSSMGVIYVQNLEEATPFSPDNLTEQQFYITQSFTSSEGQGMTTFAGGVSIYYSHSLRLLFHSLEDGTSYFTAIPEGSSMEEYSSTILINIKTNAQGAFDFTRIVGQPVYQWMEVPNHPGLIFAMTQCNTPVALAIKPCLIRIQALKILPFGPKPKCIDFVAVNHSIGLNNNCTTLIALCEDGSLRYFNDNSKETNFWISPQYKAASNHTLPKPLKKKKTVKSAKATGSSPVFPIDFFEHCTLLTDVEFGGKDLSQLYYPGQAKHRLNAGGLYVAVSKAMSPIIIECKNLDNSVVITGVRVLVGSTDPSRNPRYIEVFSRMIYVTARSRWYDIPLTREESLQSDKVLNIKFGCSADPQTVTFIDSITLYGKSKDSFGWPDETEDTICTTTPHAGSCNAPNPISLNALFADHNCFRTKMDSVEKMMANLLRTTDLTFKLANQFSQNDNAQFTEETNKISQFASEILTMPVSANLIIRAKSLLASLHMSKGTYHNIIDEIMIAYVATRLKNFDPIEGKLGLDAETFFRLVLMVRSVAMYRISHLNSYGTHIPNSRPRNVGAKACVEQLLVCMWFFLKARPKIPAISSVLVKGLTHVESVIHAIVDILQQLLINENQEDTVKFVATAYSNLLLNEDIQLSSTAKEAIIRVLRPKIKKRQMVPYYSNCESSCFGAENMTVDPLSSGSSPSVPCVAGPSNRKSAGESNPVSDRSLNNSGQYVVQENNPGVEPMEVSEEFDAVEPISLLQPNGSGNNEASGNFPMLMNTPPNENESIIEIDVEEAQRMPHEEPMDESVAQILNHSQMFQNEANIQCQYSDISDDEEEDDEGSTAATDGSTLRTSPAEQVESADSDSGGEDSITGEHNVSGRSSAYGDTPQDLNSQPSRLDSRGDGLLAESRNTNSDDVEMVDIEELEKEANKLHSLRLAILAKFTHLIPQLKKYSGVQIIPFLQVVLMLVSNLDCDDTQDKVILEDFILSCGTEIFQISSNEELDLCTEDVAPSIKKERETLLLLLKFLSLLMMRSKNKSGNDVSQMTATKLLRQGFLNLNKQHLSDLHDYWKEKENEDKKIPPKNILKPRPTLPLPDFTPFFFRSFVKSHASDLFEIYPELLTEILIRISYQIVKHNGALATSFLDNFKNAWYNLLCIYMMIQHSQIRRQVKKLFLCMCTTKERYRRYRDFHALICNMGVIKKIIKEESNRYDDLVELVEHLKSCADICKNRPVNWQLFCENDSILEYFFEVSVNLEEPIGFIMLNLISAAISEDKESGKDKDTIKNKEGGVQITVGTPQITSSAALPGVPSTSKIGDAQIGKDGNLVDELVNQILNNISPYVFREFVRLFLLRTNNEPIRWRCHSLCLTLFKHAGVKERKNMFNLFWSLWPELHQHGRKAVQFVDILAYFTSNYLVETENFEFRKLVDLVVGTLMEQNRKVVLHKNSALYNQLAQFIQLDNYYLETTPCDVCNYPELPFSNIKLSAVKTDSKYTPNTCYIKLISAHNISSMSLRIIDSKRTKMVKVMNVYYNQKSVQAVIELRNRTTKWIKVKRVKLESGQTEVKMEFPLPILACNLKIEYSEFYENVQASPENLQCPRCSTNVPANPGVCGNCGENAFQCHKCRAINYDEKDPFLCHNCGFCKFAKFDYSLFARPCCTVDVITNDEERTKAIWSINSLLSKANGCFTQLNSIKSILNSLLNRVEDRAYANPGEAICHTKFTAASITSSNAIGYSNSQTAVNVSPVSQVVQVIVNRYTVECRNIFEELSRTLQLLAASRKELIRYDSLTIDEKDANYEGLSYTPQVWDHCYSCSLAVTEYCCTLIRALSVTTESRMALVDLNVVQELIEYNLKQGNAKIQNDVRFLIGRLLRDNPFATENVCKYILEKIETRVAVNNNIPLRAELSLLASLTDSDTQCTLLKVKYVLKYFFLFLNQSSEPLVSIEPFLQIIIGMIISFVYPEHPGLANRAKNDLFGIKHATPLERMTISNEVFLNVVKQLESEEDIKFKKWSQLVPVKFCKPPIPKLMNEIHCRILQEKYVQSWKKKYLMHEYPRFMKKYPIYGNIIRMFDKHWLKDLLFNAECPLLRESVSELVQVFSYVSPRSQHILDMLIGYLDDVTELGEVTIEYLKLIEHFARCPHDRLYMAVKGVLTKLAELLTNEIEILYKMEEVSEVSDLSNGCVLQKITEIISCFMESESIKREFKGRLVAAVLNGYLATRRLVIARTSYIDRSQEKLHELLEEMTSGTEKETGSFMSICIETVKNCPSKDIKTPVFVFERLCSIIHPEDNDVGEFLVTIEKDPQQEDYLRGRMLGNPYKSTESGLGPLMRDIKNKICLDCELVALLDDDNGMELLVNNKIISLDLPVKQVYKKIWAVEGNEAEVMRIIYRVRGLLGDATEEFIETLDPKRDEEVNNEQTYKIANVLAECGGIKIILDRLALVTNLKRDIQLLQVILKLLRLCIKVKSNQDALAQTNVNAMETLLKVLKLCLVHNEYSGLTEQLLEIMETIISKVSLETPENFAEFSTTFGGTEHVVSLLEWITKRGVKDNIVKSLIRVLAALTYGNVEKMTLLTVYFMSGLDFDQFDLTRTAEEIHKLDIFCKLTAGIDLTPLGDTLKDHIVSLNVVEKATNYLLDHAPMKSPSLGGNSGTDQDDWKDFVSKPALKYVLYLLTGLSFSHERTQLAVAERCIPVIHRLEQVCSDEHVGTAAELLLEALMTNPQVAKQIKDVREKTKAKKKRLALAAREKQLGALGMKSNDKGQVVTVDNNSLLEQMEDLAEETGLVCVICREGYKYQPTKVLGIYTYTKRCNVEEFESKTRKTVGYSTVTHFNIVHTECHMSAVRLARTREEWESAALQNANTRCNGILPLWGPQVPESLYASSLARHNSYLQECTGHRDILYVPTIHDLKLLLLRFANEKNFHEDAGGGGPQSNMHLIPYLIHMALYVINTTRSYKREDQNLNSYLEANTTDKIIESCYEAEGPAYFVVLSLAIHSAVRWHKNRLHHLRRLLQMTHMRNIHQTLPMTRTFTPDDKRPKAWKVYRSTCLFFALIDAIYSVAFGNVEGVDEQWPTALADYIRHNDEVLLRAFEELNSFYTDKLLPLNCLTDFFDLIDIKKEIADLDTFMTDTLRPF